MTKQSFETGVKIQNMALESVVCGGGEEILAPKERKKKLVSYFFETRHCLESLFVFNTNKKKSPLVYETHRETYTRVL